MTYFETQLDTLFFQFTLRTKSELKYVNNLRTINRTRVVHGAGAIECYGTLDFAPKL